MILFGYRMGFNFQREILVSVPPDIQAACSWMDLHTSPAEIGRHSIQMILALVKIEGRVPLDMVIGRHLWLEDRPPLKRNLESHNFHLSSALDSARFQSRGLVILRLSRDNKGPTSVARSCPTCWTSSSIEEK
jgi:hypothetical protein